MSLEGDPIPAASLPLSARAPGKCILFGEHAIVYGSPALLFAIDLEIQVTASPAHAYSLNGDPEASSRHAYFRAAIESLGSAGAPVSVRATSRIPRSAGLGSSAAFVSALAATLSSARGGSSRADLAQASFRIERAAQGVGSAGDTSASVAGGFITVNGGSGQELWRAQGERETWSVRRATDPGWVWIVAYTGIPRSTGDAVRAVERRVALPDGPGLLERFRGVAEAGIRALEAEDRKEVGALMNANHELLRQVGVSHPRLEELRGAVSGLSLGSKLTGAGAGGSVLVLPEAGREAETLRKLARAGALAFAVRAAGQGASLLGPGPVG